MLITLGSITWYTVVAAVSAIGSLLMFLKPAPKQRVWGPEHDHEAEYQKLVKKLRG